MLDHNYPALHVHWADGEPIRALCGYVPREGVGAAYGAQWGVVTCQGCRKLQKEHERALLSKERPKL